MTLTVKLTGLQIVCPFNPNHEVFIICSNSSFCPKIRQLLAFVMIPLLQRELDIFKDTVWNNHRIRHQKDVQLPSSVPNHIYNFPEEYDLEKCGKYI